MLALGGLLGWGCATGNTDAIGGSAPTATGGNAPAGGAAAGGSNQGGQGNQGGAPNQGGGEPTMTVTTTGPGQPGVLVFSEYVEGSANNKAIEIANVGDEGITVGDCVVNRYQNGSATPGAATLALSNVTLAPGSVHVLCNSGFAQTALCDQTSADLQHSGNDVVELVCGGDVTDVIGRIGEDAVWGVTPTITQDATLRRSCSVSQGDTNGSDAFDPAAQWSGFAIDTFGDLGQRDCP